MLEKPQIGEACNGCGLCCKAEVCATGSFTLRLVREYGARAPGPCPALIEQDDGSAACGLIIRPRDYAPGRGSAHDLRAAAAVMIGAGFGCDEPGPDDAAEAVRAIQVRYLEQIGPDAIQRAVKLWYGV